jgi:hypothetical protein
METVGTGQQSRVGSRIGLHASGPRQAIVPRDLRCLTLYGNAVYSCDFQLHRDAPLYEARSRLHDGCVRKLRWAAPGRGKRRGYRVICSVRRAHGVIWMLTMYPKNFADNIPTHVLRQIRKEVEDG